MRLSPSDIQVEAIDRPVCDVTRRWLAGENSNLGLQMYRVTHLPSGWVVDVVGPPKEQAGQIVGLAIDKLAVLVYSGPGPNSKATRREQRSWRRWEFVHTDEQDIEDRLTAAWEDLVRSLGWRPSPKCSKCQAEWVPLVGCGLCNADLCNHCRHFDCEKRIADLEERHRTRPWTIIPPGL